ncbi:hypothetical protein [Paenibacillus sp. 276b]|uniref:hypothetical protein n=1 Tax=Paenibacillus sp. 276b TaxID=1566277 RepID=UPI00089C62AA|nr:hypothetical protein [Paenibacillus sp. 276b]SEB27557.1 hypothetical protein SAMN03159332_6221 [Paenibacillus sp. 276b]
MTTGDILTLFASLTAALCTLLTLWQLNSSQGKQRLIETVTKQRIEWINKIRLCFSEYSELMERIPVERTTDNKIGELQFKLSYLCTHIDMLLNPKEIVTQRYIEKRDQIKRYLWDDYSKEYSPVEYYSMMQDLQYLQQVILKSEWKRLKRESRSGKEVNDMNAIHFETAEDIDPGRFIRLLHK